jgi:hypothetical protein
MVSKHFGEREERMDENGPSRVINGIRIDKGVALPTRGGFPFAEMEVGDSIFVPNRGTNSVANAANSFKRSRKLDWSFITRGVTESGQDGTRIWRIK